MELKTLQPSMITRYLRGSCPADEADAIFLRWRCFFRWELAVVPGDMDERIIPHHIHHVTFCSPRDAVIQNRELEKRSQQLFSQTKSSWIKASKHFKKKCNRHADSDLKSVGMHWRSWLALFNVVLWLPYVCSQLLESFPCISNLLRYDFGGASLERKLPLVQARVNVFKAY